MMSYDPDNSPHPHAITGAAACLLISDIPFTRAVAGVRVALVDGEFIVNPTGKQMEQTTLEVIIAGTESAILMIEGFADFVPEDTMLEALEVGHRAIAEICAQMTVRSPAAIVVMPPTLPRTAACHMHAAKATSALGPAKLRQKAYFMLDCCMHWHIHLATH